MGRNNISIYGFAQYPQTNPEDANNSQMDISAKIAKNLTAWMDGHKTLSTLKALSKYSGAGFGTVQRAKNGEGNITVQSLEMIAKAFRRDPIELLADTARAWATQAPVTVLSVAEPPPDERELLQGYRDASDDVREIMLEAARKATSKKSFLKRSEIQ